MVRMLRTAPFMGPVRMPIEPYRALLEQVLEKLKITIQ